WLYFHLKLLKIGFKTAAHAEKRSVLPFEESNSKESGLTTGTFDREEKTNGQRRGVDYSMIQEINADCPALASFEKIPPLIISVTCCYESFLRHFCILGALVSTLAFAQTNSQKRDETKNESVTIKICRELGKFIPNSVSQTFKMFEEWQ